MACLQGDCVVAKFASGNSRAGWGANRPMADRKRRAVLVWDERGTVFAALRRAPISAGLWRVSDPPRNDDLAQVDLAIAAVYGASDWTTVAFLIRRIRTVIVSAAADPHESARALASGAFGYLDAGLSSRALHRAIGSALRGEPAYSRAALGDHLRAELEPLASRATRTFELTPRQREVVALIATGASDKEIGNMLGITTATAQKHVTRLLKRLDVPNRAAAVAATLM